MVPGAWKGVWGKGEGVWGRGEGVWRKGEGVCGAGVGSGGRERESEGPRFGEWKVEQAKAATLFAVSPSPMATSFSATLGSAAEAPWLPSYL